MQLLVRSNFDSLHSRERNECNNVTLFCIRQFNFFLHKHVNNKVKTESNKLNAIRVISHRFHKKNYNINERSLCFDFHTKLFIPESARFLKFQQRHHHHHHHQTQLNKRHLPNQEIQNLQLMLQP